MRLAPSLLFSLLMLLSAFWGQASAAVVPAGNHGVLSAMHYSEAAGGEVFIDEFEEEDEAEFAELTAHGGNSRQLLVLPACEDRSAEMYWPPEPVVVQVVLVWAPPSSRTQAHLSPAPGQLLRPPTSPLSV